MKPCPVSTTPLNVGRFLMCAVGLTAVVSCVDPFAIDKAKQGSQSPGSSGGSPGTGGTGIITGAGGSSAGTGGATGTGGQVVTGTGGMVVVGSGGAGTGGTAVGGSTGTGATDGGGPDVIVPPPQPAPVQPPEPVALENQCPPDPPIPDGGSLTCPANLADIANWFPTTPPMQAGGGCKPAPHPAGECRFYQLSWQEMLLALQPDLTPGLVAEPAGPGGKAAFLNWNTVENTFGANAGMPTPAIPVLTAGVTQAGGRQIVIDQNGNALYYSMHLNPAFVKFVNDAHLTSAAQILRPEAASIKFITHAAIVETKEAWMIIPDNNPPQAANFITTKAMVPTLSVDPVAGVVAHDDQLRMVTVAMIAIHIVHTIPGHPEFIWSSFQHANRTTGLTDLAPSALDIPFDLTPANRPLVLADLDTPNINYLLYRANTTPANSNQGVFVPTLNAATQVFTTAPRNIYRVFPGSKSRDPAIDDDVAATNDSMTTRFNTTLPRPAAIDRRPNYRLVGAIWQDFPDTTKNAPSTGRPGTFKLDAVLTNDMTIPSIAAAGGGSDSPDSITGGEDRISSVAMESFTQGEASFPNCFACHDTRTTNASGVPLARQPGSTAVMQPGFINVSHIFNEVVRLGIN